MDASLFTSMLFATVVAGTPLIIVALGLLVNEKAGVLNLGAEGMMAMGAVAAFAVTHESGNPWLGVAAGVGAGMAMAIDRPPRPAPRQRAADAARSVRVTRGTRRSSFTVSTRR